ncbi:hypothetical protein CBS147345_8491 [Aspergillus niger]|nr:hypothetical protein CBS147345_8491 [Aspergillus niger]
MNADPSDRRDSTATVVPVAICGMGMRLPGGIHDDATLYEFLLNGKDARSYTGCSRYDVRKFYDPTPRPGTIQTKHGYWLQDIDLSNFDTSMFKMSGPEVERLDPQQRLLLEVVWEAMQNAGETRWQGKEIGCYVGSFREDWLILHHSDPLDINPFEVSGSVDLALANRISYEFDFKGPSMTVKVGCSGSGTCLHLACQAIAHEDCMSAIVAGSSIILTPGVNQSLNGVGVFSAEGSCKSFDASADGYARAEAVNAIYVKRLDLAIRDGNPIRAVIRATAVNSDGNTSALVRPSADAHEQLIRKAYRRAGILNFSETAMVECHSTGTAIGDPIEADAIARVFGDEGIHIGSMGKELMEQHPTFHEDIRRMDRYLQRLQDGPRWTIEAELSKPKETSHIDLAPYAQPLTTALQVALVNLLVRWNITPSNVVGHSSGEIAAAYAAGVLDIEEAIIVSYFRGKVFENRKRRGAMAAVALGRKEISSYLEPGVVIACENSASSVTLSGDKEALETVTAALQIKEPSASIRNLIVDTAYHSPHMREVGEPYLQSIASHVKPKPPKVQMWSTVAGSVLPMGSSVSQKYWKTNLENPVLFSSAINSLLAEYNGSYTFLEIGPHSTLAAPLNQLLRAGSSDGSYAYIPTLKRGQNSSECFLAAVGQLFAIGNDVRCPSAAAEARVLTDLPAYPWHHDRKFWQETRVMRASRLPTALPHDLLVKGFCTRPLDVSGLSPMDSKVGYLQWAPDSSFQELGSLIKVTMNRERDQVLGETLFLLCALGARQDLEKATPAQPHLHRYRAWILLQLEKASRSENSLVKNSVHLFKLSPKDRDQMINMILDEAQSSDCRPIFELILKIYNSFPQLFDGSLEPLSLLMQDYSLGNIYNTGNATWDYEALFAVMGHSKPQMKILEIGGGTASLSENILQYLQSEFEEPLYQVYTFTDISTGFLSRARERLHHYPNVDYQLLDISKDPEEQGLGKESYDLIIASNVVHVTPNLHDTLTHIRKLLRPDGRLFLAEICAVTKVFNFVMGILPSWWVGENDGRVDEPYIAPEEWHSRLYKAGFTQIEASISDTEPPFRVNATFMARTARQDSVPERVTLLSKGFVGKPAGHVERMLLEMGCKVQHVLWGSTTPIQQDIISFIELEGPLFEGITDTDMEFFQGLVKSLRNVKMLWLMKPAQLHVDDPRFGLSLGMIRTIRSELGLVFATLELDDASSGNSTRAITEVFKHIRGKNVQRGRFDLDVEYVYSQGAVHVGRYHWSSFSRELEQRVPPGSANELIVGQLGVLQSLKWAPRQLDGLSPHDVRIKVHAVGLNFKDVLLASGILDLKGESAMLGIEGSGIVTAVGTDVANFSVGDRVMALSSHQSLMASEAQVASTHCIKIPNRLGFVEAATMPCVYLTVLRSLVDKAQLQRGQSILIHSASGGVGIAAITVARWIGAEVLVTAGTEEKRTFLMPHWEAAINPKVKGAWNLHNVLPKNLDFFILFASLSGNLGYYGQSNYAAANTFLDAFVQYRHGLNLPASVIDLGAVEDVGFVSRHPETLKRLNNTFGQTVSEEELRNAFHLAVTRPGPGRPDIGKHPASRHYNASQIAVGLVPTSTAAFLARDPRLSVFYNLKQGQKTQRKKQDSKLDTFVDDIKTNPTLLDDPNSVRLISREIRRQVETLMMIEPQSDGALPTLSQIGVDSLVGIEIQNWWRSMFGVDVTLLQLLEADSFQKLGELAVRQLDELTRGERESPDETSSKEQSSALDNRAESQRTVSQTKPYDAGNNIAPSSPYYDMFREDHNNVSFEGKRLRDDGHVVILTGSTGTLGAYILLELLQMPNIHRVYCLCRSADAASRQIRGFQLQGLGVPGSFKNRVEYIRVDLPAPKLGMPDTKYEELRLSVDIVVHCAWELRLFKAFDIFERIHIRGLSRLFELSQRCQYRPHIHFMSSLLALYAKETQSSSSNVQGPGQKPASPWPIGYTESKLIAEEMCRLASTKWGLPTTVYRIGQIAGSSSGNGVVWDRNQWLPSIMHSSKLIRKVPNSLGPAEVTWMPVDQAAKAICEIFQSRSSSDGVVDSNVTFNVVNPCLTRWESLLPVIQKHYAAEVVESDIWLSEVEKHESLTGGSAETIPTRLLLPLYRQIMELFNQGWTRPSYDTERTNMASETLRNMGPITPEMMERWIQQWNF